MANATTVMSDGSTEHIGAERHPVRNLLWLLGLGALLGLIWYFNGRGETANPAAAAELAQFRTAMFNTCKDERFAGPASPELVARYAKNDVLRTTVVEQFHLLQSGRAECATVLKVLNSAGY